MKRRRLNKPLIMTLIASGLVIICGVVGVIYFAIYHNFFSYYEIMMQELITENQTIEQLIVELIPNLSTDSLKTIIYIYFIVSGILSVLLAIPSIVFAILCFKDNENSVEEFQKRNKLHIWLLISIGLGYFGNNYELGSSAFSLLSTASIAAIVLYVISFFTTLKVMNLNKRAYLMSMQNNQTSQEEVKNDNEHSFESAEGKQIGEENLAKPEEKTIDPEEERKNQIKLDEMYSLLAKLEKSYKNNEITQEDYERMKKTILENYLN